jgi:hypothetical protein
LSIWRSEKASTHTFAGIWVFRRPIAICNYTKLGFGFAGQLFPVLLVKKVPVIFLGTLFC